MAIASTTSIVVITRDRPDRLRACLSHLAGQAATEIVVVDDGSEDERTIASIATVAGARLVRQEPRGMATARNTGARHARGAFLLFTDDDCIPATGWSPALATCLAAGADVVAGPTRAARPDRALDSAWQLIADELVAWHGTDEPFSPGSNFGARAEALAAVPFDSRFDGVGAEDRDWWARVRAVGLTVGFVPDAMVEHAPDLDLASFALKQVRYGRGAYRFRAAHHGGRIAPSSFYRGLIRAAAREGADVVALVALAQFAAAAGFLAEAATGG